MSLTFVSDDTDGRARLSHAKLRAQVLLGETLAIGTSKLQGLGLASETSGVTSISCHQTEKARITDDVKKNWICGAFYHIRDHN
jgi:hypothetical protein